MISLGLFLILWLVLLAIYAVFVLLTLIQMLRHGLPSPMTYVTTAVFLLMVVGVVVGTGFFLLTVDWTETVHVIPAGMEFLFGGSAPGTPSAPSSEIPL